LFAHDQNNIFGGGRKFKFLQRRGGFILSLGFFSGGNGFAQRAGMFAIEGFDEGFLDGSGLKIVRQHGGPRDRLERHPMQADRRDKRENHGQFTQSGEHGDYATPCRVPVKIDSWRDAVEYFYCFSISLRLCLSGAVKKISIN
jgi:hypothetical protein